MREMFSLAISLCFWLIALLECSATMASLGRPFRHEPTQMDKSYYLQEMVLNKTVQLCLKLHQSWAPVWDCALSFSSWLWILYCLLVKDHRFSYWRLARRRHPVIKSTWLLMHWWSCRALQLLFTTHRWVQLRGFVARSLQCSVSTFCPLLRTWNTDGLKLIILRRLTRSLNQKTRT